MYKYLSLAVLMLLLLPIVGRGQSADALQKALTAEATRLQAWAMDETIVDAVKRQNAKGVSLAEIQKLDREWMAGGADAAVRQVTTGACADRLRALTGQDARYGETFAMDDQGALVCATQRTTDYWQGDEAKWARTFNGGNGTLFIDRPKLDDSAKVRLAQISLPVVENGKTIGAITVGINMDRLQ